MKRIMTILMLAVVMLAGASAAAEAKTTKKKATQTSRTSSKNTLVIYCYPEDLLESLNQPVEKVTISLGAKTVRVKLAGKAQEKTYRIDWIDDQYGDAACIYFTNGGFIGLDMDAEELTYCPGTWEQGLYEIDMEKTLKNR